MFYLYEGDTRDLPTTKDHLNFRWSDADILFSVTKRGNAAVIHFSVNKKALRKLVIAINEFCEYIFQSCEWCKMIIGFVEKQSIINLGKKCKFNRLTQDRNITIMMRGRQWDS